MAQLNKSKHQAHSTLTSEDHSDGDSDHHLEANMAAIGLNDEPTWYIDFTITSHLIGDSSQLNNVVSRSSPTTITIVGGHRLPQVGKGKAILKGNKSLDNFLYVPFATRNLISV